jgi:hypothetical protein
MGSVKLRTNEMTFDTVGKEKGNRAALYSQIKASLATSGAFLPGS